MFRVECPIEVVVRNHKRPQWVIPGNDGVLVPERLLYFISRAGRQLPPEEDAPIRYQIDLYLPSAQFQDVCSWLHTTRPQHGDKCCGMCTGQAREFFDHVTKRWGSTTTGRPKVPVTGIDVLCQKWNASVQLADKFYRGLSEHYHKDRGFTTEELDVFYGGSHFRLMDMSALRGLKAVLTSGQPFPAMAQISAVGEIESHCVACPMLYARARALVNVREQIMAARNLWWSGPQSTWPPEIHPIASIIAVTKNITPTKALERCTSPIDKTDLFWHDIEQHIGVHSWNLLQQLHKQHDFDQPGATVEDFVTTVAQKFDAASWTQVAEGLFDPVVVQSSDERVATLYRVVNAWFTWADSVLLLTRPMPRTHDVDGQLRALQIR